MQLLIDDCETTTTTTQPPRPEKIKAKWRYCWMRASVHDWGVLSIIFSLLLVISTCQGGLRDVLTVYVRLFRTVMEQNSFRSISGNVSGVTLFICSPQDPMFSSPVDTLHCESVTNYPMYIGRSA